MNSVFISGLVRGEATAVPARVRDGESPKPDSVLRVVTIQDNKQNSKDFKVLALAGEVADKLKAIPSGKRVILDGRLSSEELEPGSGIYQGVISIRRIIAVVDAMNGIDVATGTIGGSATCEALRYTGGGSPIANLNIKNSRTFTKKNGEVITTTTYLNAVAWTDKALQLEPLIPMTDLPVVVTGMLVPSEYASTKHAGAMISKIEVWADEVSAGAGSSEPAAAPAPRPERPKAASPRRTKGSDEGMEF